MCFNPIYLQKKEMVVSCRQCLECRQQRANQWALRTMFALKEYDKACFITLTYAPKYNPIHLERSDLVKFKKRLRKQISPIIIKTFDCGEYGALNYRPHFHMIILGYDFDDKLKLKKSKKGYWIYDSKKLSQLWPYGMATTQDVTLKTVAYCALYAQKSLKALPRHLLDFPEYNTMSQSLGVSSLLEGINNYLLTDEVFFEGKKTAIPKIVLQKHFGEDYKTNESYIAIMEKRKSFVSNDYSDFLEDMWDDDSVSKRNAYIKQSKQKMIDRYSKI
ncbi:MAG: replication initiator protein [Microvirus sp.]|nr:MAG: replication initiator protein [Microvirus sp.]